MSQQTAGATFGASDTNGFRLIEDNLQQAVASKLQRVEDEIKESGDPSKIAAWERLKPAWIDLQKFVSEGEIHKIFAQLDKSDDYDFEDNFKSSLVTFLQNILDGNILPREKETVINNAVPDDKVDLIYEYAKANEPIGYLDPSTVRVENIKTVIRNLNGILLKHSLYLISSVEVSGSTANNPGGVKARILLKSV